MIKFKHIMLLIMGFFLCPLLKAQTSVTFTHDSTMTDAMVANGGVENQNYGSQAEMYVFHQVGQQIPMAFRTFIQYDISSIPEGAIITKAELKLNALSVNNAQNHPIYIERVGGTSWTESAITWNNQPGVIDADKLSFTHSQTASAGLQIFDVTAHVQTMVNNPSLNNGWRIRLQSEQASSDFGIAYRSSETSNTSKRPVLNVEYVMPVDMETEVVHCTAGNDDGTLSVMTSGGSTYGISNMYFYKTIRDTNYRGTASLVDYKTTGNVQYNTATGEVTAEDLEPGIYILRILDDEYYTNSDPRLAFYQHILVGREGETTSGILYPNYEYQENTSIEYDKPANTNPLDRANTNYHSNASAIPLRVADDPNNYEKASLIKYNIDFDDQLEFTKAELQVEAWSGFFRHTSSSNALTYSLVTENWDESQVTWNSRPSIDSTLNVTVPTTSYIGYDPVHDFDTVSIVPLVNYWIEHPDENYGFEVALETYGATQLALRDYKSAGTDMNYICFEFEVIPEVETAFDDLSNSGSLTVNAPSGSLPYTYLIHTEPLGTLADLWAEIKDSTYVDSISFFTGDTYTRSLTFNDLPSGKYYVGVYDNGGNKILDSEGIVNTKIALYNDGYLDLSSTNVLSRSSGAPTPGTGRLYGELMSDGDWGGVKFTVQSVGNFHAGFSKSSEPVAKKNKDLEFGIRSNSLGTYQIYEGMTTLYSSSVALTVGDEIIILREKDEHVLYLNGTEMYRGYIASLSAENESFDIALNDGTVAVRLDNYYSHFKRISPGYKIEYPECGSLNGSINVFSGIYGAITSCTIENNDPDGSDPFGYVISGVYYYPTVAIGTYTLTVEYSVPPIGFEPGYDDFFEKQIAIGYVVEWEGMTTNYVSPLNTIQKGPGLVPVGWATANSTNTTLADYANWVQFETEFPSMGPFISYGAMENFVLKNLDGETAFMLHTSHYGAFKYDSSSGWLDGVGKEGVWRLEEFEGTLQLFKNNSTDDIPAGTALSDGPYQIYIGQKGNPRYVRTIASFCNNYPIADQYIEPKREIEGGYYIVPKDDTLRFEFNEEYTLDDNFGNLKYKVLNSAGIPQEYLLDDLPEIYGDNRFILDVSPLADGIYTLEIINDKGENWFLRFKKN